MSEPTNLADLVATYDGLGAGLYEQLDVSLEPSGPDELLDVAAAAIAPGDVVVDLGCRDASHLIELCRRHDITGIGVDPVPAHVRQARAAVTAAGLDDRLEIGPGTMADCGLEPASVDVVWCRDVLEQVDDVHASLSGAAALLRPGGTMVVFTVIDNGLDEADLRLLAAHRGVVVENLAPARLSAAYTGAGLTLERTIEVGTRWREYAEERSGTVSRKLLQLARLRRRWPQLEATYDEATLRHVEANLHWELWQFLGTTLPVIHVLRRVGS